LSEHFSKLPSADLWNNNNFTSILYLNINSIRNKTDDLELFLEDYISVNYLCLVESWLKPGELPHIQGFEVCTQFSRTNNEHGGVIIFARPGLSYKHLANIITLNKEFVFECCGITTQLPDLGTIVLISIYRSPSANLNEFMERLEDMLNMLPNTNIIICGDFNVDFSVATKESTLLVSLLSSFNLKITVSDPTRISNTSATTIDNIATNMCDDVFTTSVLDTDMSDHRALLFSIACLPKPVATFRYSRVFSKTNINKFKQALQNSNWESFLLENNINNKFNLFIDKITTSFKLCFPLRKLQLGNKNTWITPGIKISCCTKRDLYKLTRLFPHPGIIEYFKKYSKILKKTIKLAKRIQNENFLMKSLNKPSAMWKIIKNQTVNPKNKSQNIALTVDDKLLEDPQTLADVFMNYFTYCPIVNSSDNIIFPAQNANFYLFPTTETEIKSIILKLNNTSSCGYDSIPTSIVKQCHTELSPLLTNLINFSFETGTLPEQLKVSKIVPIFKKGAPDEIGNYRPISILSVFLKIFEQTVSIRLQSYLKKFDILTEKQHGFQNSKSTESAAFQLLKTVYSNLNEQRITAILACDLSKAFDLIDHELLLAKMERYGFRGVALNWFRSYLVDRQQYVSIISADNENECRSFINKTSLGVPQGSILGPVLFNIFINDLPLFVDSDLVMYADDTTAVFSAGTQEELLEKARTTVEQLNVWFNKNNLKLNLEKTNLIIINNYAGFTLTNQIQINNVFISELKSICFLGLTIDHQLTFENHILTINKKLNAVTFALRSLYENVNMQVLKTLYYGCFESILRYCILFWGCSSQADIIFKTQKRAIRAISGLGRRDSCRNAFRQQGILTLSSLYAFCALVNVYKHQNEYNRVSDFHDYDIRGRKHFRPTAPKLAKFKNSVYYQPLLLYNKLPTTIQESTTLGQFKSKLRALLLNNTFYSIAELEAHLVS